MEHFVGKGWLKLIEDNIPKLEALGAKITAPAYEKYGLLRINVDNETPEVLDLLHKIEEESGHICEECGEAGEERVVNDWVRTLCDECYKTEIEYIQNLRRERENKIGDK
ncbi:MAG: hypothetical protein ACFWTJ_15615 [Lachnoclostridium sp.]